MSWLSLSEISDMAGGRLHGRSCSVEKVSIDSRRTTPGDLFVALRGARFDGHDFVHRSIEKGAAAVLLSKPMQASVPQILVADTGHALQRMARAWRHRLDILFIALTGSNGKTTSKEMLAGILSRRYKVFATHGNQNNYLGTALSLLAVRPWHQAAVIELGANRPGEIAEMSRWVKPRIGLVLNAGAAHLEGFGSLQGVAKAKGELFSSLPSDGIGIVNCDDPHYALWRKQLAKRKCIAFGFHASAQVRAVLDHGQCGLLIDGRLYPLQLSLLGDHNCHNAAAAAAAAYAAGADGKDIAAGLNKVQAVAGRLCPLNGPKGSRLLDDSYNANPDSLSAALDVLSKIQGEHWLALGDMQELGDDETRYHRECGQTIRRQGVQRLFTVGSLAREANRSFGPSARHFDTVEDMAECLQAAIHRDVTLLVKGSRAAGMDRLVSLLRDGRTEALC